MSPKTRSRATEVIAPSLAPFQKRPIRVLAASRSNYGILQRVAETSAETVAGSPRPWLAAVPAIKPPIAVVIVVAVQNWPQIGGSGRKRRRRGRLIVCLSIHTSSHALTQWTDVNREGLCGSEDRLPSREGLCGSEVIPLAFLIREGLCGSEDRSVRIR